MQCVAQRKRTGHFDWERSESKHFYYYTIFSDHFEQAQWEWTDHFLCRWITTVSWSTAVNFHLATMWITLHPRRANQPLISTVYNCMSWAYFCSVGAAFLLIFEKSGFCRNLPDPAIPAGPHIYSWLIYSHAIWAEWECRKVSSRHSHKQPKLRHSLNRKSMPLYIIWLR